MGFLQGLFGGSSDIQPEMIKTRLQQDFEAGLAKPFMPIDEKEALCEACKAVGEFTYTKEMSCATRAVAISRAGSYVGSLEQGELRDTITRILERCCELKDEEIIELSSSEKQFIKNGIEGKFFKAFYE
ncbi:MAG: hypothetical protein K2H91_14430 [Lachnospiraceae bacterium]|nr:hypothetical protein [Lachnospiraceae bacterium]